MSIGYVLTIAVVGIFTVVALWPPARPHAAARLGYLMSVVVNEVPHLAAGLPLAIATTQLLVEGGVGRDPASLAGLGAAGMVFAGLGVVASRGIRAREVVDAGLRKAGVAVPPRAAGWAWRVALTPIPFRPRRVRRIRNLRYGTHRRHRLDVYHRRDRPAGGPVLLYLHGGGYYSGSKHHESLALLHALAEKGWVCASATYRVRPRAGFEDHLDDARAALSWVQDHAAEHGGDPRVLVMAGSSAGAHLTSLIALEEDTPLSAAICLYGYYGRYYGRTEDEPVTSTPFALSATEAPPILLAHGDHDTMTSVADARRLTTKLRAESHRPVVGIELPGGQHGFDVVRSWRFSALLDGIHAFLSDHRVGVQAARSARTNP